MGISFQDARMLCQARLRGVGFADTLTIGHQSLYLNPTELKLLRQDFQARLPQSAIKPLEDYRFKDYADNFLRDFLGVVSLNIVDYSAYQGANIIHDLNRPVPPELWGRFDAVIEGGSLEHIFNFPVAISNLMKMIKVGGSLFMTTPANNLCGHGFYQFSPELMFRVFAPENGFELQRVALFEALFPGVELTSNRRIFEVSDPAFVRARVGLVSKRPVMMMVEARKIEDIPLFTQAPLQSDYVSLWKPAGGKSRPRGISRALVSIFERLPVSLQARVRGYRQLKVFSFSNKQFYKRL
jgi:SAM-dependent methyltransferase